MKVGYGFAVDSIICLPTGVIPPHRKGPIKPPRPKYPRPALPPAYPDPCTTQTWKLLDAYYTHHPEIHEPWRIAGSPLPWSPYDYFMRINMKRMSVGMKGISLPPPGGPKMTYLLGIGDIDPSPSCPVDQVVACKIIFDHAYLHWNVFKFWCITYDPLTNTINPGFLGISYYSPLTDIWWPISWGFPPSLEPYDIAVAQELPALFRVGWGPTPESIHEIYEISIGPTWKGPMWSHVNLRKLYGPNPATWWWQ